MESEKKKPKKKEKCIIIKFPKKGKLCLKSKSKAINSKSIT